MDVDQEKHVHEALNGVNHTKANVDEGCAVHNDEAARTVDVAEQAPSGPESPVKRARTDDL